MLQELSLSFPGHIDKRVGEWLSGTESGKRVGLLMDVGFLSEVMKMFWNQW